MSAKTFSSGIDDDNDAILAKEEDFEDEVDDKEEDDDEKEQDEEGDEEDEDEEKDDDEAGSSGDEIQEEPEEQGVASTSRNVGKKYKRWNSNKERDKHYKQLNNGPTIPTRKKIGEVKIYPPIPPEGLILEGYAISQFGRVRLQNGTITTGSRENRPSIEIPHYKTFTVSRLVASSFGLLTDNSHDVDHIDPTFPLNHSLSNLQTLSRVDHSLKTHRDNPQVATAVKQSLSKPILGRKLGSQEEFTWFLSSRDAEKATGADSSNIRSICAKRHKNPTHIYNCGGYEWKYADRFMGERIPEDAIWKQIILMSGEPTKHHICQHGLIRREDGFVTRGHMNSIGRYEFVSFQVSILVALYFLDPPKNPLQTTVNHKDLNPLNNHVTNLEWATDQEQILHSHANNRERQCSKLTKKCKFRTKNSEVWIVCDSITEASRLTGVSVRALRKNFNRETFTEKGYKFEEIEVPLLPGENFVPLRLYFKSEQKPRRAPKMIALLHESANSINN